jgi:beta-glucosidase
MWRDMSESMRFPDGFYWGAATSAHQVEGNNRNNQWWEWEEAPGHIEGGVGSGVACDHYNRFDEDFALAEEFGHNAHRFSIEWSRVEPEEGRWDEKEVEHYRRVVDSIRCHGMTPFATLHHFCNPLWVEAKGGWLDPEMPDRIARYAGHMAKQLGDAVPMWLTINEPAVVPAASYLSTDFPPGEISREKAMTAARHVLIALGKMYHAIKEKAPHAPPTGHVFNMIHAMPASDSEADVRAAGSMDRYWNTYWMDGLRDGTIGRPAGSGEEVPGLKGAWDFIGVNYYSRAVVARTEDGTRMKQLPPPEGAETSSMGWEVYPEGFYQCIKKAASYGLPVYVTENGIGTDDDEQRCRYIVRHLQQVGRAIGEGVDVRSYLHWSFQDNFEWAEGFRQKFGLIAMEEGTRNRLPRPSAYMFRDIARANAVSDELLAKYGD